MRGCGCLLLVVGVLFGLAAGVPNGTPYARSNRTVIGVILAGIGGLMAGWSRVRRKH